MADPTIAAEMIFPNVAKGILETISKALEKRTPITVEEALKRWGDGYTWQELTSKKFIFCEDIVMPSVAGLAWFLRQKN